MKSVYCMKWFLCIFYLQVVVIIIICVIALLLVYMLFLLCLDPLIARRPAQYQEHIDEEVINLVTFSGSGIATLTLLTNTEDINGGYCGTC